MLVSKLIMEIHKGCLDLLIGLLEDTLKITICLHIELTTLCWGLNIYVCLTR